MKSRGLAFNNVFNSLKVNISSEDENNVLDIQFAEASDDVEHAIEEDAVRADVEERRRIFSKVILKLVKMKSIDQLAKVIMIALKNKFKKKKGTNEVVPVMVEGTSNANFNVEMPIIVHPTNLVEGEPTTFEAPNDGYISEYEASEDEIVTPETSQEGVEVPIKEGHKRKKFRSKVYNPKCDFKEVVQSYCIANGYNIRWTRTCKRMMEAQCAMGCPWRIFASWMKRDMKFMIKSYNSEHKCSRNMRNRQATVSLIANYYLEIFRRNPNWSVQEMEKYFQVKFYISIGRMKAYRSKWEALRRLHGSIEDHYAMLGFYLTQLRIVNPTSMLNIICTREFMGAPPMFQRLYIGFDALRKGFLQGCRPIIGFDGCFLKTFLGGQLLSAVGKDGNNQMFPIAWAVIEGGNYESWS
ncbi:hypothetical protein Cni_G06327 [Canna indica]|uniref:Transposase MuDR plant domain-containing protein n=1 Tax=Canna indica TaxID=4628 RepID=A0AAQ3JYH8_9LILI|nr:hypothetical protein Cni_G06327 [Canna indica]